MTDKPAAGVASVRLRERDSPTDAERVAVDFDLAGIGVQRFERSCASGRAGLTPRDWNVGSVRCGRQ